MDSIDILLAVRPELARRLFTAQAMDRLRRLGALHVRNVAGDLGTAELCEALPGKAVLITGWGTPRVGGEALRCADALRLIAHTGSAIGPVVTEEVFARGIAVTQAGQAMAPAVAEFAIAAALSLLRGFHRFDREMQSGHPWPDTETGRLGRELSGCTVGVVGASRVGVEFIRLATAFGCRVLVFDPYLDSRRATALGAAKAELGVLLSRCDVLSLHAPATPETHHMIGAAELARLRDGSILVNTARSSLVDTEALIPHLTAGRLCAALDVYDSEPWPGAARLAGLANVVMTPHAAGASIQARRAQGDLVVAEIERFLASEDLQHAVSGQPFSSHT
ncbi:2-hydroxyacid dehydrogenase [Streptosporangium violaceochromogenes]|nr:2-hydroxyacid dehydrogenase [Streptosporangium violaceochromogenes]